MLLTIGHIYITTKRFKGTLPSIMNGKIFVATVHDIMIQCRIGGECLKIQALISIVIKTSHHFIFKISDHGFPNLVSAFW